MKKIVINVVIATAIVLFGQHAARFMIEHRIASGLITFGGLTMAPAVKAAFTNSGAELKVPFTGAVRGLLNVIAVASEKAVSKMNGSEIENEDAMEARQGESIKNKAEKEASSPSQKSESLQDQLVSMRDEVLGEMEPNYDCYEDDEDEFTD